MHNNIKVSFLVLIFLVQLFLLLDCSDESEHKENQQIEDISLSNSERKIKNLVINIYGLDSTGHILSDTELIDGAIDSIVKIGEPAIPFLIEAMKKEDGGFCGTAAQVLSKMGEPGFKALLEAVENKWRPLTETVIEIGKFKDKRALPALKDILKDTSLSFTSRAEAGVVLSKMGDTVAVNILLEMLEDEENPFYQVSRDNVIIALGKIGDEHATSKLIDVLKHDKDSFVRGVAANALGAIGDKSAINALENALNDEDKYVRAGASWALKQITGKNYEYENPPEYYKPIFQCFE